MQPLPATWLHSRSLISIQREEVDDHSIQGFLIGMSDTLLAIEYVHDFQIDGLMILRRSDITELARTATDEFQDGLMAVDGIKPVLQSPSNLDLQGWHSLFQQLNEQRRLLIVESELAPDPRFLIGRTERVTEEGAALRGFSGVGEWYAETAQLNYDDITCVQVNTRYIGFYERYFERLASTMKAD